MCESPTRPSFSESLACPDLGRGRAFEARPDVSTVPLRTSSERLSLPAPERLDILRRSPSTATTPPSGSLAWMVPIPTTTMPGFDWISLGTANVLTFSGQARFLVFCPACCKHFSRLPDRAKKQSKNIPTENAGFLKGSCHKLQRAGQAGCPHLEPRNNAFYWR